MATPPVLHLLNDFWTKAQPKSGQEYDPTLPDWPPGTPAPPSPPGTGSRPPSLNKHKKTDSPPTKVQLAVVGSGSVLPIVYGKAQVGPKVGYPWVSSYSLYAPCYWCVGEVQSITILCNGDATKGALNEVIKPGPDTPRHYLGTQTQTLDDLLASSIEYTDAHPGVAYSVLRWGANSVPSDIVAEIEGRKVYDPRRDPSHPSYGGTGSQSLGTPTTWEYTTNPALCLADFHQMFRSAQESIDWASVATCADHCDVDLGGGVLRSTFGLAIERRAMFQEHFDVLKEYALCNHYYDGDTLVLVPSKASTAVAALTEANIVQGSLTLEYVDSKDIPDQVVVKYTNTEAAPWTEEIAQTPAPAGGTKNQSVVSMSGWQSHQEAYRYAVWRYNRLNQIGLTGSFKTHDEALAYAPGDVITITHSRGLAAKAFTVTALQAYDLGRYTVSIEEYQNVWTDTIQETGVYDDITLPSPTDFPSIVGFTADSIVEKLWADQTGKYHTVFEVSFAGGDWPHTGGFRYRIERTSDAQLLDEGVINYRGDVTHSFVTPPTSQDQEWTVYLWVQNSFGQIDEAVFVSAAQTGNGKSQPPLDIPLGSLTTIEAGQFVRLTWGQSGDSDLSGYIVKRLDDASYSNDIIAENDPWENLNAITVVQRIDAERVLLDSQPVGTYWYGVRAIDRVGNVSPNPRWVQQVITADGAGGGSFESLRAGRNRMVKTFDATDTRADGWNRYSSPAFTITKDQVGLTGLANTASLLSNPSGTRLAGTQQTLGEEVRQIAGRAFIRKDVTKNYTVSVGLECSHSSDTGYDINRVDVNQATGAYTTYNDGHDSRYDEDVRQVSYGGFDWWEVTLSMINKYGKDSGTSYSDVFSVFLQDATGGSIIVGGLELLPNMSTPEVAGTRPMMNGLTAQPLSNMGVHEQFGVGVEVYSYLGDSWVDRFGVATSGWPADETEPWVHNQSSSGANHYVDTVMWDTGDDRSGNWAWQVSQVRLFGSGPLQYITRLATEAAYPTVTGYQGAGQSAEARFIQPRFKMVTTGVDQGFSAVFPAATSYQGQVLTDQVEVNILAQATPTSFSWNKNFIVTPKHWATLTSSTPVLFALDSVTKDGGTAKAWAADGTLDDAAATITVYAQGN